MLSDQKVEKSNLYRGSFRKRSEMKREDTLLEVDEETMKKSRDMTLRDLDFSEEMSKEPKE